MLQMKMLGSNVMTRQNTKLKVKLHNQQIVLEHGHLDDMTHDDKHGGQKMTN